MKRGYFGVAVLNPKASVNVGTLWRSANLFGASFISVIGARYKHQVSDTMKTYKHVPLYQFSSWVDFLRYGVPEKCQLIAVELTDKARPIQNFVHPERAVYLLGAEDHGIPEMALADCDSVVKLPGERSLNMAVAGSIVLFDRIRGVDESKP